MTGIPLFVVVVGACTVTSWIFRFIDWIEGGFNNG